MPDLKAFAKREREESWAELTTPLYHSFSSFLSSQSTLLFFSETPLKGVRRGERSNLIMRFSSRSFGPFVKWPIPIIPLPSRLQFLSEEGQFSRERRWRGKGDSLNFFLAPGPPFRCVCGGRNRPGPRNSEFGGIPF